MSEFNPQNNSSNPEVGSKQVSLTWEQILNDDHGYENCDYDEDELDRKMAADEEAWQFDGFTS